MRGAATKGRTTQSPRLRRPPTALVFGDPQRATLSGSPRIALLDRGSSPRVPRSRCSARPAACGTACGQQMARSSSVKLFVKDPARSSLRMRATCTSYRVFAAEAALLFSLPIVPALTHRFGGADRLAPRLRLLRVPRNAAALGALALRCVAGVSGTARHGRGRREQSRQSPLVLLIAAFCAVMSQATDQGGCRQRRGSWCSVR